MLIKRVRLVDIAVSYKCRPEVEVLNQKNLKMFHKVPQQSGQKNENPQNINVPTDRQRDEENTVTVDEENVMTAKDLSAKSDEM